MVRTDGWEKMNAEIKELMPDRDAKKKQRHIGKKNLGLENQDQPPHGTSAAAAASKEGKTKHSYVIQSVNGRGSYLSGKL